MFDAIIEQIVNGTMMGSIYVLVGLGLVLIYGVMHVLNFAHGMIFMLGGYMAYTFFAHVTGDYASAVVLSMATLMAFGFLLEQSVFRPLRGNLRNQVIASLALVLLIQNSVVAIWGPTGIQFNIKATEVLVPIGAVRFSLQHILVIVVTFLSMGLLFLFLKYTKFGTALRATSQDNDAALIVGINTKRMYWVSFAIGSALAALGGALIGPLFLVFPQMGDLPLVKALAGILLGGMGSIPGAVIGGLIIGITEALSTLVIPTDYRDAVTFVVIILILLFRPQGLFGVRVRGEA
jgi:branched-chain amino acid transport system permease protein